MTTRAKFTRFLQPVTCHSCGKRTTWSDANGNIGLDLCKDCFDAATLENAHFDGYHEGAPDAACKHCKPGPGPTAPS